MQFVSVIDGQMIFVLQSTLKILLLRRFNAMTNKTQSETSEVRTLE